MEPVSYTHLDVYKRQVKSISKAADYTAVLTGVVFTAEIMFITVTALMLAV